MRHSSWIMAALLAVTTLATAQTVEVPSDSLFPSGVAVAAAAQQQELEQMQTAFTLEGNTVAAQAVQALIERMAQVQTWLNAGQVDKAIKRLLLVREQTRDLMRKYLYGPFAPDSTDIGPPPPGPDDPPLPWVIDSTGTVIWPDSSGTFPPDSVLGPTGDIAPVLDSAEVADLLDQAAFAVDSFRTGMTVPQAIELLNRADAVIDSARAMLADGRIFQADRVARQIFQIISNAVKINRLEYTFATEIQRIRDAVAEITADLGDDPNPEVVAILAQCIEFADSAQARVDRGALVAAADALARAYVKLDEARTLALAGTLYLKAANRIKAEADSIDAIAGDSMLAVRERTAEARALADSALAWVARNDLVKASREIAKADAELKRARKALKEKDGINERLRIAEALLDTLRDKILSDPLPEAAEVIARIDSLADSVRVRLELGDVDAAEVALATLDDLVKFVKNSKTMRDWVRANTGKSLAVLTTKQALADSLKNGVAKNLLARAMAALDSAEQQSTDGRSIAAAASLHKAQKLVSQAHFVMKGADRAAKQLAELRRIANRYMLNLPIEAYFKRGVVLKGLHFADSAEVALNAKDVKMALRIAERTIAALERLVGDSTLVDPTPIAARLAYDVPMDGDAINTQEVVDLLMHYIGEATDIAEGTTLDAAMEAQLDAAVLLQEQVNLAVDEGTLTESLASDALDAATLALAMIRGDAIEGVQDDPETLALIAAGDQAVVTDVSDGSGVLPVDYALSNAPNPFNPQTSVLVALPEAADVRVVIYNVLGQEVVTLVEGRLTAGVHTYTWNGRDKRGHSAASGIYFARMVTNTRSVVLRMTLLK